MENITTYLEAHLEPIPSRVNYSMFMKAERAKWLDSLKTRFSFVYVRSEISSIEFERIRVNGFVIEPLRWTVCCRSQPELSRFV